MTLPYRIGTGYDIHPFAEGRPLWLGGVAIPHEQGLLGHSDADVLLHAMADAILGAAGLPDIGHYFPPSDEKFCGLDSKVLLAEVVRLAAAQGYRVGNIDSVVVAEAPRIKPHLDAMKRTIAPILRIETSAVGIKATTNEQLGALGRGEGIAALATALLVPAH